MNATLNTAVTFATSLVLAGLTAAQAPSIGGPLGDGQPGADRVREQPEVGILVVDDVTFELLALGVSDADYAGMFAAARPDVVQIDDAGPKILVDAFPLDGGPVIAGLCGNCDLTFTFDQLGDATVYLQVLALDDGNLVASEIKEFSAAVAGIGDLDATNEPGTGSVGDGDPSGERIGDCEPGKLTYDGLEMKIALEADALHFGFESPSSGYSLNHYSTTTNDCGTDVHMTLEEPYDGQPVTPNREWHEVTTKLEPSAGHVRVFIGRIRQDGDILFWDFQLAAVFAN